MNFIIIKNNPMIVPNNKIFLQQLKKIKNLTSVKVILFTIKI